MELEKLKQSLKKELAKSLEAILETLDKMLLSTSRLYNDYIHLQGRLSMLNRKIRQGILSEGDIQLEQNRIRHAFLAFIDELAAKDLKMDADAETTNKEEGTQITIKGKNIIANSNINVKGDFNLGDKKG